MLFISGRQDKLFPVPGVESAFQTMHAVWSRLGKDENLKTELLDIPHSCGRQVQEQILQFFDKQL